jgi:CelD/BcsL family acetyltransferase involved in cellulose biosynthesis
MPLALNEGRLAERDNWLVPSCTKFYEIDPLQDVRWPEFLERHSMATLFHSKEWLDALHRTFGYRPSVLTNAAPGEPLTNGLAFCRVRSWLTGRRMVSVPFSDHCTPLIDGKEEFAGLLSHLRQETDQGREKYLEVRSIAGTPGMPQDSPESSGFCLHRLDLRPSLNDLFHSLHESCIRRKISRAHRQGVTYQDEMSEELLQTFYQLVILTRRRHEIPPQPLSWFRNLIACLGDSVKIRLASCNGEPAAGILTIRYKNSMTYKYGCSDPRFHRLGPMQMLMWRAIQEAKENGLAEFDMGRTAWTNRGLLIYKDRWGATRSTLLYLRDPAGKPDVNIDGVPMRIAKRILSFAPDSFLRSAGNVLYRHIG